MRRRQRIGAQHDASEVDDPNVLIASSWMSALIVDPNAQMAAQAKVDLKKLCPDPAMTIHPTSGAIRRSSRTVTR